MIKVLYRSFLINKNEECFVLVVCLIRLPSSSLAVTSCLFKMNKSFAYW